MSNLAGSVRELLAGDALEGAEGTVAGLMASTLPPASTSSDTANDHHVAGLLDGASNLREAARASVEFLMATESGVPSLLRLLARLLRTDPMIAATTADTVCSHVFDADAAGPATGERPLLASVAGAVHGYRPASNEMSHSNPIWIAEVNRIAPLLGFGGIRAERSRVARVGGR